MCTFMVKGKCVSSNFFPGQISNCNILDMVLSLFLLLFQEFFPCHLLWLAH